MNYNWHSFKFNEQEERIINDLLIKIPRTKFRKRLRIKIIAHINKEYPLLLSNKEWIYLKLYK